MNEDLIGPDDQLTRDGDLADWQAFSLAYYEPILRALRILRVPEEDVGDLAHSFLLKAAEKDFLKAFLEHREQEQKAGKRARFRSYLYRSLQHHVIDAHRKRTVRSRERGLGPEEARLLEAEPDASLNPDTLYALDVLHQAFQALRRHCERTGKPHVWTFFEETLLANEFRGRRGKTRAELLRDYPDKDASYIDNSLTTAKRAFRRFVQEVIPLGLRDDVKPSERFEEWMEILRHSNASQFNLLQVAYRVSPFLTPGSSEADSSDLLVEPREPLPQALEDDDSSVVPDDDEMSILLSFHLEMPLTQVIDAAELRRFIPPGSPLWPMSRKGPANALASRPICLLSIVDPMPSEAEALRGVDLVGVLTRIKSSAKQLRHRPDHTVPKSIAQLIYTLVSVVAATRHGASLHSIGHQSLARNVRRLLEKPWLDDRVRPLLASGLTALEALSGAPTIDQSTGRNPTLEGRRTGQGGSPPEGVSEPGS